jgi:hypothetical protein
MIDPPSNSEILAGWCKPVPAIQYIDREKSV